MPDEMNARGSRFAAAFDGRSNVIGDQFLGGKLARGISYIVHRVPFGREGAFHSCHAARSTGQSVQQDNRLIRDGISLYVYWNKKNEKKQEQRFHDLFIARWNR